MEIIIKTNFTGNKNALCTYDNCEEDSSCFSYDENYCDSACAFDSAEYECRHDGDCDGESGYRDNVCSEGF